MGLIFGSKWLKRPQYSLCFLGSHVQAAVNTSPRHAPKSA